MRNFYAIGVDLGGQSARFAVVDTHGAVLHRTRVTVDAKLSCHMLVDLMADRIAELRSESANAGHVPTSIGMVMPGYMDRERTRLEFAANLPHLSGSNFLESLRQRIDLPIAFDADCNGAAWGEFRFGAGRDVDRLIVATVGTGIGAGVIIDGRIVRLRGHIAGSLGHVVVDPQGPRCPCGGRGCLEALASGRALEQLASRYADDNPSSRLATLRNKCDPLSGVEVGLALQDKDEAALSAVREIGRWLGVGLAGWAVIFAPQKVVIGGGIASLGEPYFEAIRQSLREVGQPSATRDLVIEPAKLGAEAGVIGAAALGAQV